MSRSRRPETWTVRALGATDPSTGAIVPPVHPSVAFRRDSAGHYPGGHSYARDQSPGYGAIEGLLAKLEGGADALLFASGMAAATTLFECLEPGARVVAPDEMYWTIRLWLQRLAEAGRIDLAFVPAGQPDALERAVNGAPTALVWLESPSNPLGRITDLAAATQIAHAAGALVAVDGTLATPVLTRPLELGADLVMHSATKQLNGHTDVLAGVLVARGSTPLWERIRTDRGYRGAVLGPFETWLLQRGLRTLFLRVHRSSDNALAVARALDAEPEVLEVLYPGLPEHPGHAIAAGQMEGRFGPIVSFRVRGGEARARRVAGALEVFHQASSLGGVESLVEHRASVEGAGTQVPDDLLRLSIGIEHAGDLIDDLRAALART